MIAVAQSTPESALKDEAAISMPWRTFSIGSRSPINPVEQTTTSPEEIPKSSATFSALWCVSRNPSGPVHAFAPPLLSRTAETSWSATTWRDHVTGAATTLFDVKTAVPKFNGP